MPQKKTIRLKVTEALGKDMGRCYARMGPEDLEKLGANEVIPEEFETSVEIFSRVLNHYQLPRNVISEYINNIRTPCNWLALLILMI